MRLKGTVSGTPGASSASGSSQVAGNVAPAGHASESMKSNGSAGSAGVRQGGTDFQQILNRMPPVTLADLHKGDAVLIVATQGSSSGGGTAITLLSGVEPILQAAPNGSQAMMLTPWSLGGAPGADAMQ
jgi:hypothetical protein